MPHDDYEQIANDIAGPDAREALRTTAEALHRGESIHMHDNVGDKEPCSYCWLRAGRALRALREFSGHPAFAAKAELVDGDDELKASEVIW